ncbi:hypothetical protein D3C79_898920 [compost metagenome]
MRPRTLPVGVNGPDRSTSVRYLFHDPSPALTCPLNSAVGRLRTRLIVAEGSPAPVSRPVAPRSTSTWS